jgi:cyclopropane fatty-acyl-phospholipid synthase-like methyltransferase
MINWKNFFQSYRIISVQNDNDLLFQVGSTVAGKPISKEQFDTLINSISTGLNLKPDDTLLEICCGNGVNTFELAKKVKEVVGVDSSAPYLQNAKTYKNSSNIEYILADALEIKNALHQLKKVQKFNKILLYSSLAYFKPQELIAILKGIDPFIVDDAAFLIGSILDKGKKWNFYNTTRRKLNYFIYKILGKDLGVGRWWSRKEIEKIAGDNGYTTRFLEQPSIMHTAHYRVDALLTRKMR